MAFLFYFTYRLPLFIYNYPLPTLVKPINLSITLQNFFSFFLLFYFSLSLSLFLLHHPLLLFTTLSSTNVFSPYSHFCRQIHFVIISKKNIFLQKKCNDLKTIFWIVLCQVCAWAAVKTFYDFFSNSLYIRNNQDSFFSLLLIVVKNSYYNIILIF